MAYTAGERGKEMRAERAAEAREGRMLTMQRTPKMIPQQRRASAFFKLPFIGGLLQAIYVWVAGRGVFRAISRRQPLRRAPHVPGSRFRPLRARTRNGALAQRHAGRLGPGSRDFMARATKPSNLRRRHR